MEQPSLNHRGSLPCGRFRCSGHLQVKSLQWDMIYTVDEVITRVAKKHMFSVGYTAYNQEDSLLMNVSTVGTE
jgi:hypothetical protein